jgi:hypothetical protein
VEHPQDKLLDQRVVQGVAALGLVVIPPVTERLVKVIPAAREVVVAALTQVVVEAKAKLALRQAQVRKAAEVMDLVLEL